MSGEIPTVLKFDNICTFPLSFFHKFDPREILEIIGLILNHEPLVTLIFFLFYV